MIVNKDTNILRKNFPYSRKEKTFVPQDLAKFHLHRATVITNSYNFKD